MKTQHDVFAAGTLFLEALSGDFHPPTDTLGRTHKLSRLALGVAQKGNVFIDSLGREYPDGKIYKPTWANRSTAQLWLPEDGEPFAQQLIIGENYGNYPREILFTHEPTRIAGVPQNDYLVIRDTKTKLEEAHHIAALGPKMDAVRSSVAEHAQDFYNGLKPNR